MRYFFHLRNGTRSILDREGKDYENVDVVREGACTAVEEFRTRLGGDAGQLYGWRLEVVDAHGRSIVTIPLTAKHHALQSILVAGQTVLMSAWIEELARALAPGL